MVRESCDGITYLCTPSTTRMQPCVRLQKEGFTFNLSTCRGVLRFPLSWQWRRLTSHTSRSQTHMRQRGQSVRRWSPRPNFRADKKRKMFWTCGKPKKGLLRRLNLSQRNTYRWEFKPWPYLASTTLSWAHRKGLKQEVWKHGSFGMRQLSCTLAHFDVFSKGFNSHELLYLKYNL